MADRTGDTNARHTPSTATRRACDLLLAVLLLCVAFHPLAHAAGPAATATLGLVLHAAAHHLGWLIAAAAVIVGLRAVPHPSARLLELLLGAWAVRLLLRGTAAA
jgi:hypothetical protein